MLLISQLGTQDAVQMSFTQVLSPYMGVFFVAFVVAFICTPTMRCIAKRYDIVDRPDAARKIHIEPIPYLGGVAIFLGWLAGILLSQLVNPHYISYSTLHFTFPFSVAIGAAVILITGLFDDVLHISARVKLGGQLFAAAALASQNVGIRLVDMIIRAIQTMLSELPLSETLLVWVMTPVPSMVVYMLGTIVIAVFVLGACNALNLLDGMDGLAAGVTAIACVGFLLITLYLSVDTVGAYIGGQRDLTTMMQNDAIRIVMCLAILGAILGFLPFNFGPATIFMGDAGSLLLGFLCAATMLMFALVDDGKTLLAVTASLIVFALPITDTSLAIFRRKMVGQPLSAPDDKHLHHLLRRAGYSVRQSVFILYGVAIMFASLGVLLVAMDFRWRYVLAIAMVLYAFIFVYAYKIGHRYHLHAIKIKQQEKNPPTHENI